MITRQTKDIFKAAGLLLFVQTASLAQAENATEEPPPVGVPAIVLTDGSRTVVRTAKELGLYPQVDVNELTGALKRIAPQFAQAAVNASLRLEKGQVRTDPGMYSRTLNIVTTAERIQKAYRGDAMKQQFTVALDKKPPVLTADRLQGIDTVLSRVETKAWQHPGRNHNISLAASLINGTLISPGEQFSINKVVGERTKARGFRESIIFVKSQEVKGVGGGVSQITGTLFNAAAEAGMRIDEAHFHSRPVPYLPLGYDATVAWGQKDMKFTNTLAQPVYVAMDWKRPYLTATVFGAKQPGRQVKLKASVNRIAPGKINAILYRTIKENGRVVEKAPLVKHAYRWDPNDNEVHDD